MSLLTTMQARRSIRQYTGEPIPETSLKQILQAGLLAPTSQNLHPCSFVLVRNKEVLTALANAKQAGAGMLRDADAAIVVLADEAKADTWVEDSAIALSYMNLMAVECGVGSCWIQMHLRSDATGRNAEENVRKLLGANPPLRVVGALSLGMPAEERDPQPLDALDWSKVTDLT